MSNRGVLYWRICPTRIRIWWIYIYMYITPGRDKTEMTQAPFWHCSRSSVCCNCVHLVWCNAPEKYMFVVFVGSSSVSWWKKSTMLSMAILGTDWLEVPTTYIYIYGLFFREYPIISPQFIWPEIWYVYLHLLDPEDLPCCLHRFPQGDRLIARSLEPWLGPGITRGENWGRENGLLGILKYHFEVSVRTHPLFSWVMFN